MLRFDAVMVRLRLYKERECRQLSTRAFSIKLIPIYVLNLVYIRLFHGFKLLLNFERNVKFVSEVSSRICY